MSNTLPQTRAKSLSHTSQTLKNREVFFRLAETFQALGDASRIQIVWALAQREHCVGDLVDLTQMSQPSVSHHLRTLRNLRLVRTRREGRTLHYALDDQHIERLLNEGIKRGGSTHGIENWAHSSPGAPFPMIFTEAPHCHA